MTQPSFVPITEADQVRPARRLTAPRPWMAGRVAEVRGPVPPTGRTFGVPGPDQGYALLLAERLFADRIRCEPEESKRDALEVAVAIACARAACIGRAPVAADLQLSLTLLGFLGDAPADLIAWRKPLVRGAGHDYGQRRRAVDAVPEKTLRMTPAAVANARSHWWDLVADEGVGDGVDVAP